MDDFFINSESFELLIIKDFISKKQNVKINDDDIPMFLYSDEFLLDNFIEYLTSEGFKNSFIIFNLDKDEKNNKKNKALYISTPFSFNELIQSLQSILIKKEAVEYHDIKFKKLFLNMTGKSLKNSKISIKLTDKEAKILWHLLKEKSSNVSQSFLLKKVWGYRDDIETKTLTTHIYTMRKKIKNFSSTFSIENSNQGYFIKFK